MKINGKIAMKDNAAIDHHEGIVQERHQSRRLLDRRAHVRAAATRVIVVIVLKLRDEISLPAAAVGTPRMRMTRGPFLVPFAIVRGP